MSSYRKKPPNATVRSLLDDVFNRPEKEVKYFVGMMAANAEKDAPASRQRKNLAGAGATAQMTPAVFLTQMAGNIQIQHGWDGDDYVWHIEPANKRKWNPSVDRAIYAAAKTMKDVIPDDIFVKIFRPYADWEVKVFTFKAIGLKERWNVTQDDLNRLNLSLFKVLNALV
jgi:hypothetical protein